MKAKIHISVAQYEFIEFELDGEDLDQFDALYRKYHKRGERLWRPKGDFGAKGPALSDQGLDYL